MVHLEGEVRDILGPVEGAKVAFRSKSDYPVAEGIMVSSPAQVTTEDGKVTADLDEGPAVMMVQAPGDSFYREFPMIVKPGDSLNNALVRGGLEAKPDTPLIEVRGPVGPRGPAGPKGDRGDTGPRGLKGDQGDVGPRGLQGDTGPQGPIGKTGATGPKGQDGTVKFDSLTQTQKASLRGEPGPKGDVGPKGDQGEKGPAGPKGDAGASAWSDITGKPAKFPPEDHKHTSADISDAVGYFGSPAFGNRVVKTNPTGHLHDVNNPTEDNHLARKGYVDNAVTAAGNSGVLFYGFSIPLDKGASLFIATPRLMGKVEFKSSFSGDGRSLVMPVVYDNKGNIVHDAVDTWGATTAFHSGVFTYGRGQTTHSITLPAGYWIDGIVIGGWDGGSNLRSLEFTAERVAPVQATAAEYSALQAYELRARKDHADRLIKTDSAGRITVHDSMFANAPDAVVNKRYVDSTADGKADKSHRHPMSDIIGLPTVSDAVSNKTIVQRSENGTIRAADPQGPNNVATQKYVDARIQLVSSLPSSPASDVLYVITE